VRSIAFFRRSGLSRAELANGIFGTVEAVERIQVELQRGVLALEQGNLKSFSGKKV
jgi:hypothetical protein